MPERSGHDLLEEWRRLLESLASSAGNAVAARTDLPREVLKASQRQLELVREIVERERRMQGELASLLSAPVDALFDLLEETGETLRRQAEALGAAGRALEETAGLMRNQAERFERSVAALRQPAELAKAAAGVKRRSPAKRAQPAKPRTTKPASGAKRKPAKRAR
jgi:signal transduction histidine kinase